MGASGGEDGLEERDAICEIRRVWMRVRKGSGRSESRVSGGKETLDVLGRKWWGNW